jgi:hypothetical protein
MRSTAPRLRHRACARKIGHPRTSHTRTAAREPALAALSATPAWPRSAACRNQGSQKLFPACSLGGPLLADRGGACPRRHQGPRSTAHASGTRGAPERAASRRRRGPSPASGLFRKSADGWIPWLTTLSTAACPGGACGFRYARGRPQTPRSRRRGPRSRSTWSQARHRRSSQPEKARSRMSCAAHAELDLSLGRNWTHGLSESHSS